MSDEHQHIEDQPVEQSTDPRDYTQLTLEQMREGATRRKRYETKPHKMTEAEKEHWEKVMALPEPGDPHPGKVDMDQALRRVIADRKIVLPQPLGLGMNECKLLLWRIIQFWEKQHKREWVFTPENKALFRDLLAYFTGATNETMLDLSKGIFLYGQPGRGKTQIMDFMLDFLRAVNYYPFLSVSCKRIEYDVGADKTTEHLSRYFHGHVCFHDLGFESEQQKVFGSVVRPMETIIEQRYINGARTHVTSNVKPEFLDQFYDMRITSRAHEMFNFIHLEGPDYRQEL